MFLLTIVSYTSDNGNLTRTQQDHGSSIYMITFDFVDVCLKFVSKCREAK